MTLLRNSRQYVSMLIITEHMVTHPVPDRSLVYFSTHTKKSCLQRQLLQRTSFLFYRINREQKNHLERDWSNKVEHYDLELTNVELAHHPEEGQVRLSCLAPRKRQVEPTFRWLSRDLNQLSSAFRCCYDEYPKQRERAPLMLSALCKRLTTCWKQCNKPRPR